ncbi:hypothetical protein BDV25DRAFT_135109 [Aspergillus avenaceus]|uniref:Uncharacterized protein n=1 Tax=Aspergillus avenaceus TaxID=36643 RepID=A0A5N6U9U2_ASPAV|nr:hypothetical protein BDV25DRAFT_135109 [Aspergillus avenaceus]
MNHAETLPAVTVCLRDLEIDPSVADVQSAWNDSGRPLTPRDFQDLLHASTPATPLPDEAQAPEYQRLQYLRRSVIPHPSSSSPSMPTYGLHSTQSPLAPGAKMDAVTTRPLSALGQPSRRDTYHVRRREVEQPGVRNDYADLASKAPEQNMRTKTGRK